MLIEKTTLIQFDEVAERARILNVFKGKKQEALLSVLDLMVARDFVAMARAVVRMEPNLIEFMAMPIQDVVQGVVEQRMCEMAYEENGRMPQLSAHEREMMGARGIAIGAEAVKYPRFVAIEPTPAPA